MKNQMLKSGRRLAVQVKLDRKRRQREMEHKVLNVLGGIATVGALVVADIIGHQGIVCQ